MILYTDKTEIFECNIDVEGTSIDNTKARLIIESNKWNLVFYGEVDKNGKCKINIENLSILKEGETGNVRLEVIAEDTVFVPWKDEFSVKTNKKVTVEVVSHKENTISENKKKVTATIQVPKIIQEPKRISEQEVLNEISKNLKQKGITQSNAKINKTLMMSVIFETMSKNDIDDKKSMPWLSNNITGIVTKLEK